MVFVSTCAGVSYFADLLKRVLGEVTVLALHGKMKYTRQNLFDRFFAMESGILVSTDVMARGIDVPDVDWVVQFDPPSAGKAFIHRCGRTARNGRVGHALLYLLQTETSYVNYLQLSQKVDVISLPSCHVGSTFTDERKFVETIRNELTLERLHLLINVAFLFFFLVESFTIRA
jgi:ATP-dependent RNA helicase DDX55/SPB4